MVWLKKIKKYLNCSCNPKGYLISIKEVKNALYDACRVLVIMNLIIDITDKFGWRELLEQLSQIHHADLLDSNETERGSSVAVAQRIYELLIEYNIWDDIFEMEHKSMPYLYIR